MIDQNKFEEVLRVNKSIKSNIKAESSSEAMQYLKSIYPIGLFNNHDYTQNVMVESLKVLRTVVTSISLPMIETTFKKSGGMASHLRGLLWEDWKAPSANEGTSIFLADYDNRGDNNLKKKAYFSGLTTDLYEKHYEPKIKTFFTNMLSSENQNKPLMQIYEDGYLNLYWDLHLQLKPNEIPEFAKQIGLDFIKCGAIFTPVIPGNMELALEFKRSYEYVRNNRQDLLNWVSENVQKVRNSPSDYTDCFVYYWLQNDGEGTSAFSDADITFECFHNYLALSQWGHTIYRTTELLRTDNDSEDSLTVRQRFEEAMLQSDTQDEHGFTPLDYFTFELFRFIVPNGGSISSYDGVGEYSEDVAEIMFHSHATMANSPVHWEDAEMQEDGLYKAPFNPDRYQNSPMSHEINLDEMKRNTGIAGCPFKPNSITTEDGRTIENNLFGTTFSKTADGMTCPVIETAGFSPFGFGYRRCPGEILTINVFKTFLRHVWEHSIEFHKLDQPFLNSMPIAPGTYITDNIGMTINARV